MKNGDWIKWVLGVIVITVLPFMCGAIWSNDKDARTRDYKIEEKLVNATLEQNTVNTQILIQLAKIEGKFDNIQVDLGYIKEKVKN